MFRNTLSRRRPGFTLVELLVVIALMILLMALAAAIFPSLANSQRVVRSADRVSKWLLIAKARAKAVGAPRGLRLYATQADPASPTRFQITECQYIEAPNPWNPNPDGNRPSTDLTIPQGRLVFVQMTQRDTTSSQEIVPNDRYRKCYFVGTPNEIAEFNLRVSRNDYVSLPEYGGTYRITNLDPASSVSLGSPPVATPAVAITLASYPHLGAATSNVPLVTAPITTPVTSPPAFPTSPPPLGSLTTYSFAFQSAPQTLMGDPIMILGSNTVIDWRRPELQTPAGTFMASLDSQGYRDWFTPNVGTVNAAPYHPSTTTGVTFMQTATGPPVQGQIDILFSPTGQVLNNSNALICLWFRDPELTPHPRQTDVAGKGDVDTLAAYNAAGEQVLVVINTRSGLVSTKPVVEPPAVGPAPGTPFTTPLFDPYQFAKDGLDVGL